MDSFGKWLASAAVMMLAPLSLSAQTPAPGVDKEKKICRMETRTGSLVAHKKVCKTRAQWDAEMREAQAVTQQFQEPRNRCGSAGPGGC